MRKGTGMGRRGEKEWERGKVRIFEREGQRLAKYTK